MGAAPSVPRARNRRTLAALAGVALFMVGMSYAAVPLYELFCRATGLNGTTQIATAAPVTVGERVVTVQFNADVSPSLAWRFAPVQRQVEVKVGEEKLVYYRATNMSKEPLVGTAVFNVTPDKAGLYFNKIQCFCFTEQLLLPGQSVDMPVVFFIDPDMVKDRNVDDLNLVTLSYMFFEAKTDRARQLLSGKSAPNADKGADKSGGM